VGDRLGPHDRERLARGGGQGAVVAVLVHHVGVGDKTVGVQPCAQRLDHGGHGNKVTATTVAPMVTRIPKGIDPKRIPRHVACVMDGNGRWATKRGLPRTEGHAAGEEALFDTVDGALDLGLQWLTVYAFSTENWKRPLDEVRYLMNFNERILTDRRDELHGRDVRITFAGRRDWRVPKRLLKRMDEAVELTKNNKTMTLTI